MQVLWEGVSYSFSSTEEAALWCVRLSGKEDVRQTNSICDVYSVTGPAGSIDRSGWWVLL
jgi:hypothetical protein